MNDSPIETDPTPTVDPSAILRGAVVAACITVPAGVVQNVVGKESGLTFALLLVTLVGLGVGGYVAGRAAPRRAMTNGGLAALAVYVVVQGIGIVLRTARGDSVSWLGIPFVALLSLSCGVVGGYLAFRRSAPADGSADASDLDDPSEETA